MQMSPKMDIFGGLYMVGGMRTRDHLVYRPYSALYRIVLLLYCIQCSKCNIYIRSLQY